MSEQDEYVQTCWMEPDEISQVTQAFATNAMLSVIEVILNPDAEITNTIDVEQIPEGKVLVAIKIPREGIDMPYYFGEFCKALNEGISINS